MPRQAESYLSAAELRSSNAAARNSCLRHGGTNDSLLVTVTVPSVSRPSSCFRRYASYAPSRRLGYAHVSRASAPVINERGGLPILSRPDPLHRRYGGFSICRHTHLMHWPDRPLCRPSRALARGSSQQKRHRLNCIFIQLGGGAFYELVPI